ncbi:hypothetical protein WPS_12860 [Vulcanimicrobium alpinum]|uniref:HAMP domain-containing protein n=1 Tax=Vulcanimicrobium alpinum TaxID=3016050 RepID=A0AAN1XVZ9_UNVUL|nr:Cache 3/Cache 2 fusion domain-containing protein [Vulcanimicrobium alpinum]BDE06010.1 hypothetical protein WPS_12860 [Vulcanimicrobium alpinum]
MDLFAWWRRSRAARILAVTAAVFLAFAATLLVVVRTEISRTIEDETRARVQTASEVLRGFADSAGEMHLSADGKSMMFGTSVINNDFTIVDRVKQVTGADATVFQIIGGKPMRISTTLMQDGKRIVGTELKGVARDAFENGQDYDGMSLVLGLPYINHYALVHDPLGNTIGILYDGIPLAAEHEAIARAFTSILIIALIAIAVVLGLLWLVVRPLASISRRLARDAEALAEGRVDDVRPRGGDDELGRIAESFGELIVYQRAIADVAAAIADGDLSRSVNAAGSGDRLGNAVARMTETLREIVIELQQSSGELGEHAHPLDGAATRSAEIVGGVGVAVRELAAGSADLSTAAETSNVIVRQFEAAIDGIARGAVDQATQVRAASNDAQRMTADVERVAEITADLASAGQQTRTTAQSGAKAVHETIADMTEIQRGVALALEKIASWANSRRASASSSRRSTR